MEFELIRQVIFLLALTTTAVFAQSIQLTPAQQQMLNQLPPAQRQQAMDALRESQPKETAPDQQSINEPVSQVSPSLPDSVIEQSNLDAEPRAEARSRLVITFTPSCMPSAPMEQT